MSSSGLIYAVIVGAWAAYLVPMWLRRQDELNDSRPTERFSTAIRLLSGRAAMERRHAREREAREGAPDPAADGDDTGRADAAEDAVAVRDLGDPDAASGHLPGSAQEAAQRAAGTYASGSRQVSAAVSVDAEAMTELHHRSPRTSKERGKRAKVLARRRRTTMVLFLSFTFGAIIAAVGGLRFLWAPGIPAVLLSAYIVYLRAQERRRFAVRLDNQRAESAARRLHERRRGAHPGADPAS
ncbi:divisome protein SepX/GlpR, partial [Streptomyces sparsus]